MNLTPLLNATPPIPLHAIAAIVAFFLGALQLFRRKGGKLHKTLGWIWVILLVTVSISSFFINEIRMVGPFGPIHILSVMTLFLIARALWAIKNGNFELHRRSMQFTYIGGMIIAGGFTFLPDRIMHQIFFGS